MTQEDRLDAAEEDLDAQLKLLPAIRIGRGRDHPCEVLELLRVYAAECQAQLDLARAGFSPRKQKAAVVSAKLALPLFWLMQQRPYERYVLRRWWGPDAINLIESARKLHKQALAERAASNA